MSCLKTGCHAYVEPYGEWVYGDLHAYSGCYIMRVTQRSRTPIITKKHATILVVEDWWDQYCKAGAVSTIISLAVDEYTYEGVECADEAEVARGANQQSTEED